MFHSGMVFTMAEPALLSFFPRFILPWVYYYKNLILLFITLLTHISYFCHFWHLDSTISCHLSLLWIPLASPLHTSSIVTDSNPFSASHLPFSQRFLCSGPSSSMLLLSECILVDILFSEYCDGLPTIHLPRSMNIISFPVCTFDTYVSKQR